MLSTIPVAVALEVAQDLSSLVLRTISAGGRAGIQYRRHVAWSYVTVFASIPAHPPFPTA
jgi:hypothetical protein